jgi:hypothetical protein
MYRAAAEESASSVWAALIAANAISRSLRSQRKNNRHYFI